jgi:subtilase family serine protease
VKSLNWVRSRRAGAVLAAGAASTVVILGVTAPAGASTPPKVAVAQGLGAAALKNLSVFGTTPSSTPELVSFVLQPRNQSALQANVEAGMPGGYLSVRQFAAQYGQTQADIAALKHYLAGFGITVTVDADDLNVQASGTAGDFDSALSVQQHQYRLPAVKAAHGLPGHGSMTIHGTTQTPLLPRSLGQFVLAVLGLDNYPTFASNAVKGPAAAPKNSSGSQQIDFLPPSFFTQHYGLNSVLSKATGAGETIGIVTLAALNPTDPETFWNSTLGIKTKQNRITIDNVDGGPGAVSVAAGSDETTLDVEQSGAIAPNANIDVYQAPNNDPGFTDAFYNAASQNVADSVSTSWGSSETVIQDAINSGFEDPNYIQAFNNVMLEMGAQGQSNFTATGDFGAYQAAADEGTLNLAVGAPADSPWTTATGGTTLAGTQVYTDATDPTGNTTFSINIPAERTWGWDYLWPFWQQFGIAPDQKTWIEDALGGSSGGFSVDEPTPAYQQGISGTHHFSAVELLQPTSFQEIDGLFLPTDFNYNPTPSVTTGNATGRALPDVSTDGDPQTGYEVYMSEFATLNPPEATVEDYGGTSFVAPQLNGATAVIDSYLGHRVGFWNPSIYRFATLANSPFTPLDATGTGNDNLFYTGTRGQLFNAGSGLGIPDLAKVAADFARFGG